MEITRLRGIILSLTRFLFITLYVDALVLADTFI